MSAVGKKAVVYAPLAKVVWDHAGSSMTSAAQQAYVTRAARRKAVDHADTLTEGAVLRVVHRGHPHWVVFSQGAPVTVYPELEIPLERVLLNADRSKLMTAEQARLRARESGARARVRERGRRLLPHRQRPL